MKTGLIVAVAMVLTSGSAFAQSPALSVNTAQMNYSREECLSRAERVIRDAGLERIERVGITVFADTPDRRGQLLIRCNSDERLAIFVAAAGARDEKETTGWVNRLRAAFIDLR